ncbi:hypothetical protein [Bosea sp. BH3]|uniref:hypothetical protein n=1 Tax=Bosea sp. BH3 TaxID=2871701 RepID=UPI0021CB4768|nr:hypothetical protein [Bosea sp. BH3]MCU4179798.1 hypothetical protein [Bosea sp. BH3]
MPAPESRYSAKAANSEFCAARFSTFSVSGELAMQHLNKADADAAGEQSATVGDDDADDDRAAQRRCGCAR